MRIGVDIKALRNPKSGIPRYIHELLYNLQKIDSENEYILYEPAPTQFEIFNSKWKRVTVESKLPGTLWLQTLLPYQVMKDKIDLLWCPEQMCPFFKIKNCCIVTTIHDFAFKHYLHTLQFSTAFILQFFFSRVIRNSSHLIANSEFTQREIHNFYPSYPPERTTTAVCGTPSWTIPPCYSSENRQKHLLFVGNLEPRKNMPTLIKALEILKQNHAIINLHIVGPRGWKRKNTLEMIEKSQVSDQIIFRGFLSDSELQEEYLKCKAFIYPSIYEGFGIPVLEALSLDCLVLTSQNTVMQEIAGPCGVYFDPLSPIDIAEKIQQIYAEDFKREKYLGLSSAVLKNYRWDNSAAKILHTFKSCKSRIESNH